MSDDQAPTTPQTPANAPESAQEPRTGPGRQPDAPEAPRAGVGGFPDVQGRCPACGGSSLMLADGGYITCRRLDCPQPDAASEVIAEFWQARQHGAFTFCDQLVGHVSMTEFAKKISEKREAIGQRAEAAQYANEQKRRTETVEAAIDRVRVAVHVADDRDVTDWQRGYRACSERALAALEPPAPDDGPTVREAAADDKRWWGGEKCGE